MIDGLKFSSSLEEVIVISSSLDIEKIYQIIEEENVKFIIIQHSSSIYLLSKEMLEILIVFEGNEKLSNLIKNLPSLIVTDKPVDSLQIEDLEQYFEILNETVAEGIIVLTDNKISGVLSSKNINKCLQKNTSKYLYDLHGGINSAVQGFICKKCSPPSYRFPREGNNPTCPKDPLHGKMNILQ